MSALKGFNNVLIKFIDKVLKWYPDLSDLRTIKTGAETIGRYNPRMCLDQFMSYIGPYYVQIFNKQEQFFTDLKNFQNDTNVQKLENELGGESVMSKMAVFKDIWDEMSDERKAYVWKMFAALLKVGALASNDESYKIILKYVDTNPGLFETK